MAFLRACGFGSQVSLFMLGKLIDCGIASQQRFIDYESQIKGSVILMGNVCGFQFRLERVVGPRRLRSCPHKPVALFALLH